MDIVSRLTERRIKLEEELEEVKILLKLAEKACKEKKPRSQAQEAHTAKIQPKGAAAVKNLTSPGKDE